METLMELVNNCEKANNETTYTKKEENLLKVKELRELGFYNIAKELEKKVDNIIKLALISEFGYIKITEDKIKNYLKMKVSRYNNNHPTPKIDINSAAHIRPVPGYIYEIGQPFPLLNYIGDKSIDDFILTEFTNDYNSTDKNSIGRFEWIEANIKSYKTIPPDNILEILREHKKRNIFDYFTIAKVSSVNDPLLLGRLKQCDDRFFIAQWGDDIQIDDLM